MTDEGTDDPRDPSPATTTVISGFHQDVAGDWIAELACGHSQHMRHRPPWERRPWVVTEAGRASKLGAPIACPRCARESSEPDD
jgi:hypothetical protein